MTSREGKRKSGVVRRSAIRTDVRLSNKRESGVYRSSETAAGQHTHVRLVPGDVAESSDVSSDSPCDSPRGASGDLTRDSTLKASSAVARDSACDVQSDTDDAVVEPVYIQVREIHDETGNTGHSGHTGLLAPSAPDSTSRYRPPLSPKPGTPLHNATAAKGAPEGDGCSDTPTGGGDVISHLHGLTHSAGSVQSNRDSGFSSCAASDHRHSSTADLEERAPDESHVGTERCNSIEDLPAPEQTTQTINEQQLQTILHGLQGVTVVQDNATESGSRERLPAARSEAVSTPPPGDTQARAHSERQYANTSHMHTHVKTGLFKVFETSSNQPTNNNKTESIYENIPHLRKCSVDTTITAPVSTVSGGGAGGARMREISEADDSVYEDVSKLRRTGE